MNQKDFYVARIDKIAKESFNAEQKAIAKKIIYAADEKDLDAVWGLVSQRVKIGFTFDEAPEVNHQAVAVVKENEKLFIDSPDKTNAVEHKLIIGENYDALKNLLVTYTDSQGKGMIDVIYIDPPYNTEKSKEEGNDYKDAVEAKKFIYRDKFTRDGWLNMMNERLKLAKKLLSDDGVVFCSVDDRNQAYLKCLFDEIFGEENFVASLPTIMNLKGNQDEFAFAGTHEYTLVYAKDKNKAVINNFPIDEEAIMDEWFEDEIGLYKKGASLVSTGVNAPRAKRPNLFFPIYITTDNKISLSKQSGALEIFPISNGEEMSWRWSKQKIMNETDDIIVVKNGGINLYKKQRPAINELPAAKPKTLFYKPEYSSGNGTNQLQSILGAKLFNNPKPVALIKDFIYLGATNNATILDFFAGSGTTGQAVIELNEEDGGNRKFILVTNNENNIATDITRERLFRVINGRGSNGEEIKWEYSKDKKALPNNAVRVFDIKTENLTIADIDKAERIKAEAEKDFKKLNEKYKTKDEFDIYTQLASLNPQINEK